MDIATDSADVAVAAAPAAACDSPDFSPSSSEETDAAASQLLVQWGKRYFPVSIADLLACGGTVKADLIPALAAVTGIPAERLKLLGWKGPVGEADPPVSTLTWKKQQRAAVDELEWLVDEAAAEAAVDDDEAAEAGGTGEGGVAPLSQLWEHVELRDGAIRVRASSLGLSGTSQAVSSSSPSSGGPLCRLGERQLRLPLAVVVGTPAAKQLRELPDPAAAAAARSAALLLQEIGDSGVCPFEVITAQAELRKKLKSAQKVIIDNVSLISPINEGGPSSAPPWLLVVDLDYTILDCHGAVHGRHRPMYYKRPHVDRLFARCYELGATICFWSQTSWIWLEAKASELGFLEHPDYKISFVADKRSMFAVRSNTPEEKNKRHHVKPLELLWKRFPQFSAANTLHLDDLARNFALNWGCGLRVSAYRVKSKDGRERLDDDELELVLEYIELLFAAGAQSWKKLSGHSGWRPKAVDARKAKKELEDKGR